MTEETGTSSKKHSPRGEASIPAGASWPLVGESATSRCLLCGGEKFTQLHIPANNCRMHRCNGCGLWVNASPVLESTPQEHYADGYQELHYDKDARRRLNSARHIVRHIEGVHPPGRLVDVGCARGFVVQAAKERGWDAYGVELSRQVVEDCTARGLQVVEGSMAHLPFSDGFFDVVHARHVLEHDIELWRSLGEMRRVLRDGGLLFLTVPDAGAPKVRRRGAGYARFWKIDHMLAFTAQTLERALAQAGFAAVRTPPFAGLGNDGPGGIVPFAAWRVGQLVPDALGWGNTLRGVWRKADVSPAGDAAL